MTQKWGGSVTWNELGQTLSFTWKWGGLAAWSELVAILPFSLQRHFLLDVIQTLVCVPNVHSEINQWFQNEVSQLPKNEVNQLHWVQITVKHQHFSEITGELSYTFQYIFPQTLQKKIQNSHFCFDILYDLCKSWRYTENITVWQIVIVILSVMSLHFNRKYTKKNSVAISVIHV